MRRGAEGQTDQGPRLSERSEFERDPAWREHRKVSYWGQTPISLRCVASHPQGRAIGSANLGSDPKNSPDSGSPFFGLPYFGEAKKGESPAAATERHQVLSNNPVRN